MNKNILRYLLLAVISIAAFWRCLEATPLEAHAEFTYTVMNNDYSTPVLIQLTNLSTGAESYEWTFEGGNPASSTAFSPGQVQYVEGGVYTITLKVSNTDGSEDTFSKEINLLNGLTASFDAEVQINNYSPVEVLITNTSENASSYYWTFEGGNPASSELQNPGPVTFTSEGDHSITLVTYNSNGDQENASMIINVLPPLQTAFTTFIDPIDDDFQAPVTIHSDNSTQSAISYTWSAPGAVPSSSTEENPSFVYNTPGTYELSLTATNNKDTETVSQQITVYEDANLSIQQDIHLGINTAQADIGCFYSTISKQVYKQGDVNDANGSLIDIAFFGFNSSFSNNTFISPNSVQNYTFAAIPNATNTLYTNKIESCNCGINISAAQFDAMTDDTLLQSLNVSNQITSFNDSVVPRIIPFQTQDGRKGLIKLKEFVVDGTQSYIIIDIKVQKT